jgi:hypothetical protein
MKLIDLMEDDDPRYDSEADVVTGTSLHSIRKHNLTLRHINKLKRMRVVKAIETQSEKEVLGVMYGIPDEPPQQ